MPELATRIRDTRLDPWETAAYYAERQLPSDDAGNPELWGSAADELLADLGAHSFEERQTVRSIWMRLRSRRREIHEARAEGEQKKAARAAQLAAGVEGD